eukprot:CCRYP_019718-RA/>CCRYP_019718-RA protein AED:0.68 eAED:0.40 QI:0/-1/0/1/-1/1/1/0/62
MLLDWREAEDRNAAWDESVVTDLTSIDNANRAPSLSHGDWSSMVGYDFSTDGDDSSVVSELD